MNKDKNAASFWDRVARRYAAMPMRNPDTYEATLERIRAHLKPTDRVLELGCGTGSTALRLAPLVAQYTAVDFSAEMIAIARERQAEGEVANLDFVVVTVADGSFPDGPFDAILAFNVLHLLPDRDTAFADTFGRLRTGGLFMSKTPCLGGVYRVLQPVVAQRAADRAAHARDGPRSAAGPAAVLGARASRPDRVAARARGRDCARG